MGQSWVTNCKHRHAMHAIVIFLVGWISWNIVSDVYIKKQNKTNSMLAYREWYVARTNQIVWGMYLAPIVASGYASRTNQSVAFVLWFERCSNFNEVVGDSERVVRKMELYFRMRNVDFSVWYYWTDEIYQITSSKRVTHAVKMVDSCSRENRVLCTVTRSWSLFLHDENEWKKFESNITWGVDELHQTFWFEQFFNGKLCCKIHDLLSVPIIFFWIGLLGAISRWMSD